MWFTVLTPPVQHVFLSLAPVVCFPALGACCMLGTGGMFSREGCMFSLSWHRWHVFPLFATVACFPFVDTGGMFSCIWQRRHVFPRFAPVGWRMFSRPWHLIIFPRCTPFIIFSRVWRRLHVFFPSLWIQTGSLDWGWKKKKERKKRPGSKEFCVWVFWNSFLKGLVYTCTSYSELMWF